MTAYRRNKETTEHPLNIEEREDLRDFILSNRTSSMLPSHGKSLGGHNLEITRSADAGGLRFGSRELKDCLESCSDMSSHLSSDAGAGFPIDSQVCKTLGSISLSDFREMDLSSLAEFAQRDFARTTQPKAHTSEDFYDFPTSLEMQRKVLPKATGPVTTGALSNKILATSDGTANLLSSGACNDGVVLQRSYAEVLCQFPGVIYVYDTLFRAYHLFKVIMTKNLIRCKMWQKTLVNL